MCKSRDVGCSVNASMRVARTCSVSRNSLVCGKSAWAEKEMASTCMRSGTCGGRGGARRHAKDCAQGPLPEVMCLASFLVAAQTKQHRCSACHQKNGDRKPTLTPLRVITSAGLPRMSRANVPCRHEQQHIAC